MIIFLAMSIALALLDFTTKRAKKKEPKKIRSLSGDDFLLLNAPIINTAVLGEWNGEQIEAVLLPDDEKQYWYITTTSGRILHRDDLSLQTAVSIDMYIKNSFCSIREAYDFLKDKVSK